MGNCGAKASGMGNDERDQDIASALSQLAGQRDRVNKVLLLGAGQSGKSTILKQMRRLYSAEFNEDECARHTGTVRSNIVSAMQALIAYAVENDISIACADAQERFQSEYGTAPAAGVVLNSEIAPSIASLWADAGIQQAFSHRAEFQLNDTADYFLAKVEEVAADGYVPSIDDVLRSRARTSGLIEQNLMVQGVPFKVCDVGGQKSERRKWAHCFADVNAVIFVAALSEYDQVLFEQRDENRVVDAVKLFHEISESQWFVNSAIVLFLNKTDLFEEKIQRVDLASVRNPKAGQRDEFGEPEKELLFGDYEGGNDYEAAKQYLTNLFMSETVLEARAHMEVTVHPTCALDKRQVEVVFQAVKDQIMHRNALGSGLQD